MQSEEDATAQSTGDPLVDEAIRRFKRASEWESEFTIRFTEDLKFANGDDDNGYQWPNTLRYSRNSDQRPCLTMNIIRQHNLQIVNEAKQVKKSVTIVPDGNGATKESADVFQAIVQRIEYQSNAETAYAIAQEFQVAGGIGYWRLVTDYISPKSMDLDIFIRPLNDPTCVLLDPDIRQRDGSDALWGFIFDDVPVGEFEEAYPELEPMAGTAPLGTGSGSEDWVSSSHVRVAEYFRKVKKKDILVSFVHQGERKTILKSSMTSSHFKEVVDDEQTRTRDTYSDVVEWYLIVGQKMIDHTIWPGEYIPIIRVPGEEVVIDGMLDRKGHTRAMKGAQRMYNYNASAQVEFVALQGKSPWLAAAAAIENLESYWNTANQTNHSVLPYNHKDDKDGEIPPPSKPQPPNSSPAFEAGMDTAFKQMMMVSGQYENALGIQGNERTGAAIQKRQDQGNTSTYHFQDNFEMALVFTGKQLIQLIPKVYDTKRALLIQADDGSDREIEIDPGARKAYLEELSHEREVVKRAFNPAVGKYSVRAKPGPAYGTRREQTVEALTLILTQNPGLTGIVGDLLLSAMDFKEAQEAAQRLRRMVPKQALGEGPTPDEQRLQLQLQQMQGVLTKTLQRAAKDQLKLVGKDQMREIDVYDAETRRIAALQKMMGQDPQGVEALIKQLVNDALGVKLGPIISADQGEATGAADPGTMAPQGNPGGTPSPSAQPPVPGARQAPDGEWYMADPTRRGKYLRVAPLVQERGAERVISNA